MPFAETEMSFINIHRAIIYNSKGSTGKMRTSITKPKAPLKIEAPFTKMKAPFTKMKAPFTKTEAPFT